MQLLLIVLGRELGLDLEELQLCLMAVAGGLHELPKGSQRVLQHLQTLVLCTPRETSTTRGSQ